MAALTTLQITPAGAANTLAAAAGGGDTFVPDDRTYLEVNNGSGGAITVTLAAVQTASDHNSVIPANAVSVGAGARVNIGPLPASIYTGAITYSGVTSLTVGVRRA
jgi:hypothetical protein